MTVDVVDAPRRGEVVQAAFTRWLQNKGSLRLGPHRDLPRVRTVRSSASRPCTATGSCGEPRLNPLGSDHVPHLLHR